MNDSQPQMHQLTKAAEYLAARGLTIPEVEAHGIKMMAVPAALAEIKFEPGSTVADPFWFRIPGMGGGVNYKTFNSPGLFGAEKKWPKTLSAKGSIPGVFKSEKLNLEMTPRSRIIWIKESAIKSIWAVNKGKAAVGLSGVWTFRSKTQRMELIPDLQAIVDMGFRSFCISFDSGAVAGRPESDPSVISAVVGLAAALRAYSPDPLEVTEHHCPASGRADGKGWGYDDLCAAGRDLEGVPAEAPEDNSAMCVAKLNSIGAWVENISRFVEVLRPGLRLKASDFHNNYAYLRYRKVAPNGAITYPPGTQAWMSSTHRNTVGSLVYEPGKAAYLDGDMNVWRDTGPIPVKGDVSPFLGLIRGMFVEESEFEYLMSALAYVAQNPGQRPKWAVFLASRMGSGKSILFEMLERVWRGNYARLSARTVASSFNAELAHVQIITADEITPGNSQTKDTIKSNFKTLITDDTMLVHPKGMTPWLAKSCPFVLAAGNNFGAVAMEKNDRRWFVPEIIVQEGADWTPVFAFVRDNPDGPGIFRWWLEQRDCSAFSPHKYPLNTRAKEDAEDSSMSSWEVAVSRFVESPWDYIPEGCCRLLKSIEVLMLLSKHVQEGSMEYTAKSIANLLTNQQFPKGNDGKKMFIDGNSERLWWCGRVDELATVASPSLCHKERKRPNALLSGPKA